MKWLSCIAFLPHRLVSRRGQSLVLALCLIAAAVFFLWFGNDTYPIDKWLLPKYLQAWASVLLFGLSSLAAGWWLLAKIIREPPRLSERLLFALALGVLSFYALTFVVGIAQLYSPYAAFAIPLLLLGLGGPKLLRDATRFQRHRLPLWSTLVRPPRTGIEVLAAILIVVSLLGIYLQAMLPGNLHADAHWYHLPIAEHYVAAGGIVRFPEGWYVGVYPQLASILYTWAFMLPGDLFSHVILCVHLDFALFLVTAAGVAVLTARLLKRRSAPAAAAAIFLFPNLFIYDSNVNGGADHILAFWAAPMAVALIRLGQRFTSREAILAAAFVAAAACTKYQACYFVVPALLYVVVLAARHRRVGPLVVWLSVAALITSSHWLKNLVFYHDPLYPILNGHFPSIPFHRGAAAAMETAYWPQSFAATGPYAARLWEASKTAFTFSFVPNDWGWHGQRPTFGSLFTLLLPVLLLCRCPRRLWLLVLGTHLGLVVWYLTSHQDRFLQALLPWMASCVAALLWFSWRRGTAARFGVGILVTVQLVSGLDTYFIRDHSMLGDSPIRATAEFIAEAHKGNYVDRLNIADIYQLVGRSLRRDAVLLQHDHNAKLGIGVRVVADGSGWQGAIEYLDHESPTVTARLFQRFGVTDTVRYGEPSDLGPMETARELVYCRWVQAYARREHRIHEAKLFPVTAVPRDEALAVEPTRIAWLDCESPHPQGLYAPRGLAEGQPIEAFAPARLRDEPEQVLKAANAVALRDSCPDSAGLHGVLSRDFSRRATAGKTGLWVRTRR